MGKREFYDPYTMRVKEIEELVPELNKLVMSQLPGSPALATVWGVLCEAARLHKEASPDPDDDEQSSFTDWRAVGQSYAAHVIIRKIADGMGVSNFKERDGQDVPDGRGPVRPVQAAAPTEAGTEGVVVGDPALPGDSVPA